MYNVCTIVYTHIRSQASDWNCCVREREREKKREGEVESRDWGERKIKL